MVYKILIKDIEYELSETNKHSIQLSIKKFPLFQLNNTTVEFIATHGKKSKFSIWKIIINHEHLFKKCLSEIKNIFQIILIKWLILL